MPRNNRWSAKILWLVAFSVSLAVPTRKSIAEEISVHYHVYLPRARGATVLSAEIDARARYLTAVGDFLVSRSIARQKNATAAEQEISNQVLWLESYFKRKELNEAYRRGKQPPYLDRLEKIKTAAKRRIENLPEEILRGRPTDEMNWLLDQLVTTSLIYYYAPGTNASVPKAIDTPLSESDISHILYTDGGRLYGHKLVLRANEAIALTTAWPYALRGAEFRTRRESFEKMRNLAVEEAQRNGAISYETQIALRNEVDELQTQFDSSFSSQRRLSDWHVYYSGKNYLQNLAFRVFRAITTNDAKVFDGSYRFTGSSVIELIQHMSRHGFRFADPEPGDEGTYSNILLAMRSIYLYTQQQQPDTLYTTEP